MKNMILTFIVLLSFVICGVNAGSTAHAEDKQRMVEPNKLRGIEPLPLEQKSQESDHAPFEQVITKEEACKNYANSAVSQNKMNLDWGCGFTGPQWNSNFDYHYNWCMVGNNINNTKGEIEARQKALEQFRKDRCDWYAKAAVSYNDYNLKYGCGFTGPQWNSNFDYHYNWCMHGDNVKYINAEIKARNDTYQPCEVCESYAEMAVSANEYNIKHGCGFAGPQWNSSLSYHFKWCRSGDNWKLSQAERDKRDDANRYKCGTSSQPPKPTPPPPTPPPTKTVNIYGFKQVSQTGDIYYVAKFFPSTTGSLVSLKNPNLGLGKQWIVQLIPAGSSSNDCGKPGKTIDVNPGTTTTKLQGISIYNMTLGFCLATIDPYTNSFGLPLNWALEITYKP